MGLFDFLLSDEHKRTNIVTHIGLEAGLFQECPVCRDVTENRNAPADNDRLDAAIQQYIAGNDDSFSLFGRDENRLRDKLKQVAAKMPYDCTCESI